jgi:hypothetical protein
MRVRTVAEITRERTTYILITKDAFINGSAGTCQWTMVWWQQRPLTHTTSLLVLFVFTAYSAFAVKNLEGESLMFGTLRRMC